MKKIIIFKFGRFRKRNNINESDAIGALKSSLCSSGGRSWDVVGWTSRSNIPLCYHVRLGWFNSHWEVDGWRERLLSETAGCPRRRRRSTEAVRPVLCEFCWSGELVINNILFLFCYLLLLLKLWEYSIALHLDKISFIIKLLWLYS